MTSSATSSDSSQMPLTPDITGDDPLPDNSHKKNRRQTAIYPNTLSSPKPQKPFARSAAKRDSVLALGSIEHLQYYFTKTGLTAEKSALPRSTKALVPAIGGLDQLNAPKPLIEPLPELRLPPTPTPPALPRPAFPNGPKNYETNPDSLLPPVIHSLSAVEHLWSISLAQDTTTPPQTVDVLQLLKTTTQAVRHVRNYLVSLPDESAGTLRAIFRPMSLPSIAHPNLNKARTAATPDPLTLIRRAALDVLTALRQLEESARLPMSDDPFDVQSDRASGSGFASVPESRPTSSLSAPENPLTATRTRSRSRSPHPPQLSRSASDATEPPSPSPSTTTTNSVVAPDAISVSFVHVRRDGRDHFVPVWDADDADDFALSLPDEVDGADHERRESWDARLVLNAGWLYRQDLVLDALKHERVVVGRYLDVVDAVLFGGARDGTRGWARAGRGLKERRDGRRRASESDGTGQVRLKPRRSTGAFGDDSMVLREEPEELYPAMAAAAGEELVEQDDGDILSQDDEEPVPDEDLPLWARRNAFPNDELGRAHALLTAFLPVSLLPSLVPITTHEAEEDSTDTPPTDDASASATMTTTTRANNRRAFLHSLSSGQLLCVAYNACIRRSRRPWGYISADAIHNVIGLQDGSSAAVDQRESRTRDREIEGEGEKGKKVWTFRRTDNLRKWAGTLRLRYLLPIVIPLPLSLPIAPNPISTSPAGASKNASSSSSRTHTPSKHTPSTTAATTGAATASNSTGTGSSSVVAGSLLFDPSIVARGEAGWEDMLQDVLLRWVAAVVDERRGEA